MSGDLGDISGAVGDIGVGAAAANAVEPAAGGPATDSTGHTTEDACLNCGTPLVGAHCHSCGQKAKIHRTLRAFVNDLLHGVLHFEGKFFRTLPLLTWRPGVLMREYINGKRARYVSPIALFLFTVFVSFALFSISGGFGTINPNIDSASREQLELNLKEADESIAAMEAQIIAARQQGEPVGAVEKELQDGLIARDLLKNLLAAEPSGDSIISLTASEPDKAAGNAPEEEAQLSSDDLGVWFNDTFETIRANPGLLVYKLQTNAYKLSWLLIPLSLPFVWILFPFSRKFRMYDHTVFVTYSISFMTMLAVVLSLGIALELWPLIVGPLLYAPFHLYRSLRGSYGLSRFGGFWRFLADDCSIHRDMAFTSAVPDDHVQHCDRMMEKGHLAENEAPSSKPSI